MKSVKVEGKLIVKGNRGVVKHLKGTTPMIKEVEEKEKIEETINRIFEDLGLDVTELEKRIYRVKDEEDGSILITVTLESDPFSLLDFLVGEGKDRGLWLEED